MARFTSNRYPELGVRTSHGRVQFHNRQAEVSGTLAEDLADFAQRHPEYEIEQAEADEPRLTAKQQAQADAEALGLDTSGTTAEILARIEAHKADDSDEDQGDSDSDESDDQNDDSDEDEAGEADSSEDE